MKGLSCVNTLFSAEKEKVHHGLKMQLVSLMNFKLFNLSNYVPHLPESISVPWGYVSKDRYQSMLIIFC